MAKIVNKKSQIPKYAQRKIKDFKNLTEKQALYEYEILKLNRRAKSDIYTSAWTRPKRITEAILKEIRQLKGKKLTGFIERFSFGKPQLEYQQREEKRRERQSKKSIKQLDDSRIDTGYHPDRAEPLPNETLSDYLRRTRQILEPYTGEIISPDEAILRSRAREKELEQEPQPTQEYANEEDLIDEFFDDLKGFIDRETRSQQIAHSVYKSGMNRSSASRKWTDTNISNAAQELINLIDSIQSDPEKRKQLYEKASTDDSYTADLQDAISEYIAGSYAVVTDTGGYLQMSDVYSLLSLAPMTLSQARTFTTS